VTGGDYCVAIGDEHPVARVNRLNELSVSEREPILGKTAARLQQR